MRESYLLQKRSQYLTALDHALWVGSASVYKSRARDGHAHCDWDAVPGGDVLEGVQSIHLVPPTPDITALPAWLATLPALRTLGLPYTFLPSLDAAKLPAKLACLQVIYDDATAPRETWDQTRYSGHVLPNVRGFFQLATNEPSTAWLGSGLRAEHLPGLEAWLSDLNGDEHALARVSELQRVEYLALEAVRDAKVFESVPVSVEGLHLGLPTKAFSLSNIARLHKLRYLRINGARFEVDCAHFVNAPQLIELDILNSKKIKNVEALLECKQLKSVSFLDCAKPFKGPLKQRFKDHGFDRLEIDFA